MTDWEMEPLHQRSDQYLAGSIINQLITLDSAVIFREGSKSSLTTQFGAGAAAAEFR